MNILDYALLHGLNPIYSASTDGGEYKGFCPICGVKKDHCMYWPNHSKTKHKGGSYWCRDCDSKGDLIAFIMNFERVGYKEACEIAGVQPKKLSGIRYNHQAKSTPAMREMKVAAIEGGEAWLNSAAAFIDKSCRALEKKPEIITWLQRNKFLMKKTISRYRIGWNDTTAYVDRALWGLPVALNENGRPKKLQLLRGIVIPGYSHAGDLCRIKIRKTDDDFKNEIKKAEAEAEKTGKKAQRVSRYGSVSGNSGSLMFCGENRSRFIIVESELDAIFLAQEGGGMISAAALGSASNWPDKESYNLLKQAEKVFLCLDSDDTGKNKKRIQEWLALLPNASCIYIPSSYGKDPTAAAGNRFPIRLWLEEAVRRFESELHPEPTPISAPEINNDCANDTSFTWQETRELTDDEALILQAVELESQANNAGMIEVAYQLDRALGTFDQTVEIAVDRDFARSVLRLAINRAVAALKCRKVNLSATVAA